MSGDPDFVVDHGHLGWSVCCLRCAWRVVRETEAEALAWIRKHREEQCVFRIVKGAAADE